MKRTANSLGVVGTVLLCMVAVGCGGASSRAAGSPAAQDFAAAVAEFQTLLGADEPPSREELLTGIGELRSVASNVMHDPATPSGAKDKLQSLQSNLDSLDQGVMQEKIDLEKIKHEARTAEAIAAELRSSGE